MKKITSINRKMKQIIDKFIGFFVYSLKKLLMYRVYIISEIIGALIIPVILQFFLWRSILQTNSIGYSLAEMMRYIVISNIILLFTQIHAEHEIESDIKTYKLGQKLLLPVRYFTGIAFRYISNGIARLVIIYLPVIIGISVFVGGKLQIYRLPYTLVALVAGFLLNGLFSVIIGLLSFWLTEIWGIAAIRNLLTGVLSGAMFPLDIMPERFHNIMLMTPFPYMSYFPSKLISDWSFDPNIVNKGILISLAWVMVFSAVAFLLMRHGLKKYTSSGI